MVGDFLLTSSISNVTAPGLPKTRQLNPRQFIMPGGVGSCQPLPPSFSFAAACSPAFLASLFQLVFSAPFSLGAFALISSLLQIREIDRSSHHQNMNPISDPYLSLSLPSQQIRTIFYLCSAIPNPPYLFHSPAFPEDPGEFQTEDQRRDIEQNPRKPHSPKEIPLFLR
ncbi:hypothetical protein V2J09_017438 [Rumex salicifolius]